MLSNCYNTYPPIIVLSLSLVLYQCSSRYHQALDQGFNTCKTGENWHGEPLYHTSESEPTTASSDIASQSSSSNSDSPHSAVSVTSTASTQILQPRLPITYNEASLSCLHRRPQVRMLNTMSISLPLSDEESPVSSDSNVQESPTAESEANSPWDLMNYH